MTITWSAKPLPPGVQEFVVIGPKTHKAQTRYLRARLEVVRLMRDDGLTAETIALLLNLDVGTVESLMRAED